MFSEIKRDVESQLKKFDETAELEYSDYADFTSSVAFKISKLHKKDPAERAKEIASKITHRYLDVKAVNGYINFYLNDFFYLDHIKKIFDFKFKDKKKKIILEHTSVNPSGPIHIGRLRNAIIGDAIKRILKFNGYEVETHYFVNDMGKQIAMIALAKEKLTPTIIEKYAENKREDYLTLGFYLTANNYFEKNEEFRGEVSALIKNAELGDLKALNLMKNTAEFCLLGQKKILDFLEIKFDFFDFESDFIRNGKVMEVIKKFGNPENNKAVEINLEEYGIKREKGNIILARSDGTSVYLARDLAYHLYKINLGDELINILGEDHKQEFSEVKTILEKKFNINKSIKAMFFSFVSFEGSKFSTRKGNIITVDELVEEAIKKSQEEMKKRNLATEGYKEIGISAVKYHILKIDPKKQINFKLEDALNFDGETACYIQYAHARASRILEKSQVKEEEIKEYSFSEIQEEEKNLVKMLFKFYTSAEKSCTELKPNIMANYTYNLALEFNRFYSRIPVLDTEKNTRQRRLLIVLLTKKILHTAMNLLGITPVERM